MIKLLLLVTSLFILSCSEDNINNDGNVINIPLSNEVAEMGLSEVADSLSYTFLETVDSAIIGTIDKLIITKEYFIIVDKEKTKSVFVFNRKGKFVSKIHKVGRSKEEYLSITDVAVDEKGERIFIIDCKFKKLLEYNLNGDFIKRNTFKPIVSAIAYAGDNKIAAYCGFSKNDKLIKNGEYPNLIILDASTAEVVFEHLYFDDAIANSNVVGMISNFTQNINSATLAMPLDNAIYTIKGDKVESKFSLSFPDNQSRKLKKYINKTKNNKFSAVQATELFQNSDLAYLMNFISIKETIYLFYKCRNMYYYGFFNHEKNRYIESSIKLTEANNSMIPVYNDIDSTFRFMPISGRGENLYYIIEPSYIEYFKNNAAAIFLKENADINSNPIIASVRLK